MEDEDGTDRLQERATDARRHVIRYLRYRDVRGGFQNLAILWQSIVLILSNNHILLHEGSA